MSTDRFIRTICFLASFLTGMMTTPSIYSWSWNSADNVLPSLREELDKEIAAYRLQVGNGMSLQDRIIALDRLIGNYQPLGLNVVELETERSRLMLQEKQRQLRSAEVQSEATQLYDRGVAEYREGQFRTALDTFQEAERMLPDDNGIKELRRKLQGIVPVSESEIGVTQDSKIIRLAITRYLENDPKRALNALVYASERYKERREIDRLKQLIESNHPEVEAPRLASGIPLIDHKLQLSLEAIYDGRYLTAITECTDVLDLEPNNVLALTRLGSAYYAMNEQNKALQIWTKALQIDPGNEVLRKFLYSKKGASRVEKNQ
jgi:tetratricopeptide (TPR) repeat protein